MQVQKNHSLLPTAKMLRRNMTPHERKLWYMFLQKYPVKIYKQRIIDSFIVDFYCASAKLVIELDGSQHFTKQGIEHDKERSAMIQAYNLKVLRFTNYEIDTAFQNVCETIDEEIRARLKEIGNSDL